MMMRSYLLLFMHPYLVESFSFIPKLTLLKRQRTSFSTLTRTCPMMMPEGPEVRTLVDQLQPAVGKRLVNFKILSGRYERESPRGLSEFWNTTTPVNEPDTMMVDIVKQLSCKGKFIYIVLDSGKHPRENGDFLRSIWITLGMTGYFMNDTTGENSHMRWYMEFIDQSRSGSSSSGPVLRRIYFQDPRGFGTIRFSLSRQELMDKLASLGPDMLDNAFPEETFLKIFASKRPALNICKFLMDQSNISGIGNYILSEGLYRAKVDPFASLGELSQQHLLSLFRELRAICHESYQSQRSRKSSDFKFELQCYGRKTCIQGKPVFREIDGPHGRTIWYTNDQLFMPRAQRKAYMTSSDDEKTDMNQIETPMSLVEKSQNNVNMDIIENHSITRFLIDESWKTILGPYLNTTEFRKIDDFVQYEQRAQPIYPPSDEIFAALNKCPFDKVKVAIIGQDPYHGQGQGHGLAFSVRKGIKIPPSLQNIFKELVSDQSISLPKHGNLDSWANQGVLLLNTVLTVRAGMANSHAGHGWEVFTDEIVRLLNMQKDGLVFLLWGNQAALKASSVDTQRHAVIITSHPSPLGSTKTNSPFTGSKCFSRCNDALVHFGKEPIKWDVS